MYLLGLISSPAAKVGLENTSYTVSEDDDVVEVCAIVDSPYIVAFSFDVHLSIVDDSAGKITIILTIMEVHLSLEHTITQYGIVLCI